MIPDIITVPLASWFILDIVAPGPPTPISHILTFINELPKWRMF